MIFLKLGGSLITDKARPETPRLELIQRLAAEIAQAWLELDRRSLLLGHGSGSFGHAAASRYGTHRGASSEEDWRGVAEVWSAAQRLNRLVVDALRQAGIPAVVLPPSASALCRGGEIVQMAVEPVRRTIVAGLMPVVYGDVAFDIQQGACIVSTERVFNYLADPLHPTHVLLAGIEPGIYADYTQRGEVLRIVDDKCLEGIRLAGSDETDVTGGMADKVHQALALARSVPGVQVRIFSGEPPGAVAAALKGEPLGTLVQASPSP
ncbi:MAG: isopentenyl phosphate kinase [Anaerolineales bacterium]|jgi:isopentenyl phosphate kinase